MKEKILTLVIGILIGAILATGGFTIYNSFNNENKPLMRNGNMSQMQRQNSGEKMPGGPMQEEPGKMFDMQNNENMKDNAIPQSNDETSNNENMAEKAYKK